MLTLLDGGVALYHKVFLINAIMTACMVPCVFPTWLLQHRHPALLYRVRQWCCNIHRGRSQPQLLQHIGSALFSHRPLDYGNFAVHHRLVDVLHTCRLALGMLGLGPKYHLGFVKPDGRMMQEVARLLSTGKLKAVIAKTFPLEEAA